MATNSIQVAVTSILLVFTLSVSKVDCGDRRDGCPKGESVVRVSAMETLISPNRRVRRKSPRRVLGVVVNN